MSNSFLNKVCAERRVLSIINAHFQGDKQLAGLSKSTIDLWQRNIGFHVNDKVVETLIVLADICQSLSDRSHESFKTLNPEAEKRLELELGVLNTAIHQLQNNFGDSIIAVAPN